MIVIAIITDYCKYDLLWDSLPKISYFFIIIIRIDLIHILITAFDHFFKIIIDSSTPLFNYI